MDQDKSRDVPARFAAAMAGLGPFPPAPKLAVAVSGGADSLALALLTRDWLNGPGGSMVALVVDHGLRPESGAEADLTLTRLTGLGIAGLKLTVKGLEKGPALAGRARDARYDLLLGACEDRGLGHLLLGHHRDDQIETVQMRVLSGSGLRGLAGMRAVTVNGPVRLLRPLLSVPSEDLRAYLTARRVAWVEDPSNRDPSSTRARLRAARAGTPDAIAALSAAIGVAGQYRHQRDQAIAQTLAERAVVHPEGHAVLSLGPIDPESLAALLRMIAGAAHAPPLSAVARLARDMRPQTLGGTRIMEAGRLGPGWLLVREARAMAPPVGARPNVIWDGRFRLTQCPDITAMLGGLGADAARFRKTHWPAAVLHGLPAVRMGESVIAIPHIGVGDPAWRAVFDPPHSVFRAPSGFGKGP